MRFSHLIVLLAAGLPAQPPGRVEGAGVVILHPPESRTLAIDFLGAWPEAKARVRSVVGGRLPDAVTVELVGGSDVLAARVREATGSDLPGWVAGVALPGRDLIIIRTDLPGSRRERVAGILIHELAHIAVAARLREREGARVPRWFDEGVAQLAEGRVLMEQIPDLPMRAFFGRLIPLAELEDHFPATEGGSALAYAEAHSFLGFLTRQVVIGGVRPILDLLLEGQDLDGALRRLTLVPLETWEARWRADLRADRGWVAGFSLQVLTGLLVVAAVFLGVSRIVRRRRAAEAAWSAEAAGGTEVEADSGPGEDAGDADGEPPPSPAHRLPRHPGWMGIRRLRDGEDEPPGG